MIWSGSKNKMTALVAAFMPAALRLKITRILRDSSARSIARNASLILSANGISAILSFVTTALTARAIGASAFGTLALIFSYHATLSTLVSFQAWNAIVKFGSDAIAASQKDSLKQLVKLGFMLDAGCALAGFGVAVFLVRPTISWLMWDPSLGPLLYTYSLLLLVNIVGTPIGVLRLYNRFGLVSRITVIAGITRLAGVSVCFVTKADLTAFLLTYLITNALGNVLWICAAFWVLREEELLGFPLVRLERGAYPGFWEFVWTTNVHSTVKLLSQEIDIFVVAAFTSPAMVGLYKISKQFSRVFLMMLDPLGQTLYPELAKLWAQQKKDQFRRVSKFSSVSAGMGALAVWLGLLVLGQWAIPLVFGREYASAYLATVVYCFAWVLGFWGFPLPHVAMAQGRPQVPLWSNVVATVVYMAVMPLLVKSWNIVGAGVAFVIYYVVWIAVIGTVMRSLYYTPNTASSVPQPRTPVS